MFVLGLRIKLSNDGLNALCLLISYKPFQDSYIKKSEILYVPASLTWELDEYTPTPDTHTKVWVTKVSYGYL